MGLIVQKFGGTSLSDSERIHRAARRAIRAKLNGHRVVVVVSAMGRSTNMLLDLAREVSGDPPKRELDVLLSTGEQVSMALMAMAIDAAGHEAISLSAVQVGLFTDSAFTRAKIQRISRTRIDEELSAGRIIIIPGFQGTDARGELTTLGRGASDTTAVALAAVLGADLCEIYTDVKGIFTADPQIVPHARKIDTLGYDEVLEMAARGAKVTHSRAIEFGRKYGVPIHVCSSALDSEGTMITADSSNLETPAVRGVTLKEDLVIVTLSGNADQSGLMSKLLSELAADEIGITDITTAQAVDRVAGAHFSFAVGSSDLRDVRIICDRLTQERSGARVNVEEGLSKVSVVGVGSRFHASATAKMLETLACAGIEPRAVSTSEIILSCLLPMQQGEVAIRALHEAFALSSSPQGLNAI